MGRVKVSMSRSGSLALMRSPEVQADLLVRAERIRDRADSIGSGRYAADVVPGKNRAHARVKTTDDLSKASNLKHNSILKSIDAGR